METCPIKCRTKNCELFKRNNPTVSPHSKMTRAKTENHRVTINNSSANCYQIWIANASALTALTSGLLFGWMSPAIPALISEEGGYKFTLEQCSYFPAISCATMILSCALPGILMDKIGRKPCLLIATFAQIATCLLYAFSKSIVLFYLGRVCNGLETVFVLTILNVYLGEILKPKLRGLWGNLMAVQLFFGQFFTNILGTYFSVKTFSLIIIASPVAFLCLYSFMPESPYFYAMKDKPQRSKKFLRNLTGTENVEDKFQSIIRSVKHQKLESAKWKDLFVVKRNRRAVLTIIFLGATQHGCGFSSFAIYAKYIFLQSTGSLSPNESTIIFTGSMAVSAVIGMFLSNKLGRRRALIISLLGISAANFASSVYFYIESYHTNIDLDGLRFLPLLFLMIFVLLFGIGLGIVPELMLGELFSTSVKGKAVYVFCITFGVSSSINAKIFHLLKINCGLWSPFAFFGLWAVFGLIISYFLVPETKGKTLEEIQLSLAGSEDTFIDNETVV